VQVIRTVSSFRHLQENKNTLSVVNKEIRALLEESAVFFRSLQFASRNLILTSGIGNNALLYA